MQDFQGLEFGEVGDVEAVVEVEHVEDALPFTAGEAEEVHGGVVHAEECGKGGGLGSVEEMGMGGLTVAVGAGKEVEVEPPPAPSQGGGKAISVQVVGKQAGGFYPLLGRGQGEAQIRVYADEAAQVHEEGEVEVGDGGWGGGEVEPLEGGLDIAVERLVLFLLAQGGRKELGQEEGEGGFDGREGDIYIIIIGTHVGRTGQPAHVGSDFRLEFHHREGLPEGDAAHGAPGTLHGGHERLASTTEGEEVNDERRVAILHRAEHYASNGFLHKTERKGRKNFAFSFFFMNFVLYLHHKK